MDKEKVCSECKHRREITEKTGDGFSFEWMQCGNSSSKYHEDVVAIYDTCEYWEK